MMKMSFKRFLVNEIKKYDYSSILFELPEELTDNIISWGFDNIGNDDLIYDRMLDMDQEQLVSSILSFAEANPEIKLADYLNNEWGYSEED